MKRSDMVNLIWEAINELEDGDYILQRIEAAGMLPPKIMVVNHRTLEVTEKFQWEPEDRVTRTHDDHITYEEWRKSHGAK